MPLASIKLIAILEKKEKLHYELLLVVMTQQLHCGILNEDSCGASSVADGLA